MTIIDGQRLAWSPMLPSLPDELWANVFRFALPNIPKLSLKECPLLVTHVCRTWRRIAISFPLLWNRISLPLSYDDLSHETVELFRVWLERSNGCQLDVDLRLPFDVLPWSITTNDKEFLVINDMLSLLRDHVYRLRTLLRAYPQILLEALQAQDLPLLELFLVDPPEGGLRIFSLDTLPRNLKSFATYNTYIHFTLTTRWPMLEHLELWQTDAGFAGLSPRDCLDILSQLPSLRAVGLHICMHYGESRKNFPMEVTLPSLRSLVVSTFSEHDISLVFTKLSSPLLEAVGLDGCNGRVISYIIPGFFKQCSSTLRLAAFGQIGMIDVTLLGALCCAPYRCRVVLCSSSFDGHAASRVVRARRAERGVQYADRWSSVGSPGYMLSLAYTSEEMWSNVASGDTSYRFRYWRCHDLEQWRPAAVLQSEIPWDDGAESIQVSICEGQSVSHTCFSNAWLS